MISQAILNRQTPFPLSPRQPSEMAHIRNYEHDGQACAAGLTKRSACGHCAEQVNRSENEARGLDDNCPHDTADLSVAAASKESLFQRSSGIRQLVRLIDAALQCEKFEPLVKTFQRYDTALENKLFRAMQRMRQGERL